MRTTAGASDGDIDEMGFGSGGADGYSRRCEGGRVGGSRGAIAVNTDVVRRLFRASGGRSLGRHGMDVSVRRILQNRCYRIGIAEMI